MPRLAIAVGAVLIIALGWWIGTMIAHKRADDRATQSVQQATRQRASARAERRRELAEQRRERAADASDESSDEANNQLLRAAKTGRRDAVAREEARLTQLAHRQDAAEAKTSKVAKDPYERELDRFPIREPPLFIQQINSSDNDHVLFASVFKSLFCLSSPPQRRSAIRGTYDPIARRLRRGHVGDFVLLIVPLGSNAPKRSDALGEGSGRGVSLTSRGQSC